MLEVERTSTNMLAVVGQTQRNSHNDDNNDNEYKQQVSL